MSYPLDPCYLTEIDAALSSTGLLPKLSPRVAEIFHATGEGRRRASNRNVVLLLTVMFDLYWFAQRQSAPDIVLISGVLLLFGGRPQGQHLALKLAERDVGLGVDIVFVGRIEAGMTKQLGGDQHVGGVVNRD